MARDNNIADAAAYALERMESHQQEVPVSLGFNYGVSLLRDALCLPLSDRDFRNLESVGVSPISCIEPAPDEPKQAT